MSIKEVNSKILIYLWISNGKTQTIYLKIENRIGQEFMNRNNHCLGMRRQFFLGNEINRKLFFNCEITREIEKCNFMNMCVNSTSGDRNLLIVLIKSNANTARRAQPKFSSGPKLTEFNFQDFK